VLIQSLVVIQLITFVECYQCRDRGSVPEICGEEPERSVKFVVKNQRGLWDLWWRIWEGCEICGEELERSVRFVVKNQRGMWDLWWKTREVCEICGEEPERSVRFVVKNLRGLWDLWWRSREWKYTNYNMWILMHYQTYIKVLLTYSLKITSWKPKHVAAVFFYLSILL
jgi:hypothetical protein